MPAALRTRLSMRLRLLLPLLAAAVGVAGLLSPALPGGASPGPGGPAIADHDLLLRVPGEDGDWYFVSISMLVLDDGQGPQGSAATAARESMLARFPGAQVLSEDGVGAQYLLLGFKWPSLPVIWEYNSTGKPAGLNGDDDVLRAGAAAWTNSGANFSFSGGWSSSRGTGACWNTRDGYNVAGWKEQTGSTLAVTCSIYDREGTAIEFDMEYDPEWNWTTGLVNPGLDLQTTATHEFGHAAGLGHSVTGCDEPVPPAMCARYNGVIRDLRLDDLEAIFWIYGSNGSVTLPTRTPTPTPTQAPTVSRRVLLPQLARD